MNLRPLTLSSNKTGIDLFDLPSITNTANQAFKEFNKTLEIFEKSSFIK